MISLLSNKAVSNNGSEERVWICLQSEHFGIIKSTLKVIMLRRLIKLQKIWREMLTSLQYWGTLTCMVCMSLVIKHFSFTGAPE